MTSRHFGPVAACLAAMLSTGLVPAVAHADAVDTFILENTNNTDADDVTVTFKQPITKTGKNSTSGGDTFDKIKYGSTNYSLLYGPPTKGGGTIDKGDTFKFTVETSAGSLQVDKNPKLTYFTAGGKKIPNSAKLVSANIDLNGMGGGTVVVSNPTQDDFQFLTGVEIWTGLSQSTATTDALTWTSPGTAPTFTPADITLSPGSTDSISLGSTPANTYDLILYDFAYGPSSSPTGATPQGMLSFAATVPEPGEYALLGAGVLGVGVVLRRRATPRRTPRLGPSTSCV